ncbi:MAG: cyclic nucleotide-binding domain-containing protein [Chloroflexi bacterium]|nr:cyclic nucleotide-binding domain-containing protein [Chloroflexota bacterium]
MKAVTRSPDLLDGLLALFGTFLAYLFGAIIFLSLLLAPVIGIAIAIVLAPFALTAALWRRAPLAAQPSGARVPAEPEPVTASTSEPELNDIANVEPEYGLEPPAAAIAQPSTSPVLARLEVDNTPPVRVPRPHLAVIGVIDRAADADDVAYALAGEGLRPDDVRCFQGPIKFEHHSLSVRARTPASLLRAFLSEEMPMLRTYEDEARAGHAVIVAKASDEASAAKIAKVLAGYHARQVKHFGRWLTTDLLASVADVGAAKRAAEQHANMVTSLRGVDIFSRLSERELREVALCGSFVRISEGSRFAQQGEAGGLVYAVLEGNVQLTTESDRGEITVRVAGPGESLPLATLLGQGTQITSADAMSDLAAFELPRARFFVLIGERPDIGRKVYQAIAEILAGRYRNTLTRLVGTLEDSLRRADVFANV